MLARSRFSRREAPTFTSMPVAFQLLMTTVYPTLITSLFNKFAPLPEGELHSITEALSSRVQFPLQKLFVVDAASGLAIPMHTSMAFSKASALSYSIPCWSTQAMMKHAPFLVRDRAHDYSVEHEVILITIFFAGLTFLSFY